MLQGRHIAIARKTPMAATLATVELVARTDVPSCGKSGGRTPLVRDSWGTALTRAAESALEVIGCGRAIRRATGHLVTPCERALEMQRASARIGKTVGLSVEVHGEAPTRPCVIVANHVSYLDPIAVATTVPMTAIAKSEVRGWPAIGSALSALGVLFVQRGDPGSGAVALRKAMRAVDAGVPVLVFPEGTTTYGDDVLPFERGAFGLGALKGVPIVPVAVRYSVRDAAWVGDTDFVPHFVALHRYPQVVAYLRFGRSLDARDFEGARALATVARNEVRSLLEP
ncbi:MAG: lysophospholipid acyltransferase family protein [Myxococcota bacterium]